jgi:hypothetical protein
VGVVGGTRAALLGEWQPGDAAMLVPFDGTCMEVSLEALWRAASKIVASCLNAYKWAPPIELKGAAGAGCNRARVSSWAEIMAVSLNAVRGMATLAGKNSKVSTIMSDFVLVI